jgi:anti-sigma-K factor RskA
VPAFAVGFAAATAAIAIAVVVSSNGGLGQPDARATVQGTPEFAGVRGEARLYDTSRQDGMLRLELEDIPAPAAGEHYQVWVLRTDADGEMEAVGAFTPSSSDVSLELPLPGPGDFAAVDVSVEPDGGSPEHSGTSLAGGRFEPASA